MAMDVHNRPCTFLCADEASAAGMPAPAGADGDNSPLVYFCVRIPPSTLQTSLFLQGVSCTSGVASLPSHISADDFRFWSHQHPCPGAPGGSDAAFAAHSNQNVARLLEVADAVADVRLQEWAEVLGERAASWCMSRTINGPSGSCRELQTVLLHLSDNVRATVLKRMLRHITAHDALLGMPTSLLPAVVGAMIDESGRLEGPTSQLVFDETVARSTQKLVAQLSAIASRPHAISPLQSLHLVHSPLQLGSARVLRKALPQHRQLSQLHLQVPLDTPAQLLTTLLRGLPACPSLVDLQLQTADKMCQGIPDDFMTPLTATLPQTEALQRLALGFVECNSLSSRRRSGCRYEEVEAFVEARAQRWARFMAAAACHPSLSRLELGMIGQLSAFVWPDAFPRMRALTLVIEPDTVPCIDETRKSVPEAYLGMLPRRQKRMHAAFPCLTRLEFVLKETCLGVSPCVEWWVPLGRTSPACNSLEELKLEVYSTYAGDPCTGCSSEREELVWPMLTGTVAACPNLRGLHVAGYDAEAFRDVVTPYLPARLNLTRLQLHHYRCSWSNAAWDAFTTALAQLTSLQEFHIGAHYDPGGHFMARVLRSLASASHLTALHIDRQEESDTDPREEEEENVVRGSVLAEGLRRLQQLQVFHLEGPLVLEEAQPLWGALAAAPCLQELKLEQLGQIPPRERDAFLAALPRMKSLVRLTISGWINLGMQRALLDCLSANPPPQLCAVTVEEYDLRWEETKQYKAELEGNRITLKARGIR